MPLPPFLLEADALPSGGDVLVRSDEDVLAVYPPEIRRSGSPGDSDYECGFFRQTSTF